MVIIEGGTGGGCVGNTSAILSAIHDECSDDSDSWTLIGAIGTIVNVLLNGVLQITLLIISIFYFTCKTKSATNSFQLTS